MKKFSAILLALVLVLAMSATAFAQSVDSSKGGAGTITISNASKGETYKVYKLFDATVNADGTSIAYTGEIPDSLAAYFEKNTATGSITAKDAAKNGDKLSDGAIAALKAWAETQTADATAVSDGSALTFTNLQYGYYVVTTTQGEATISVDSTTPNATIVDKNTTAPVTNPEKKADGESYQIGDTITYTVSFGTANFVGEGEDAKKITSYTIHDTLPEFLSNVTVTKITIGGAEYKVNDEVPQFVGGSITIPWVDAQNDSLYKNGATIVITYTATVTDKVAINGEGNKNNVTISYTDEKNNTHTYEKTISSTVYSYAFALKKVNEKGEPLAGAEFELPFYVKATPDTDGAYVYAGTDAGEGLTNKVTTPADGVIIVKGVKNTQYTITETKAPNGYNKLAAPVTVTPVKTGATTTNTTIYLDENGNVVGTAEESKTTVIISSGKISATAVAVLNKTGSELPSTGGMGTTIFYVVGGLMMAAAVVILVAKKKVSAEK